MEETKPIIDVISTTNSKLSNLPIKDGQLIFVHDSKKIALDYKNARTVYEQIQVLEKESNRTELLAPINSFYFVVETSILWKYHNGQWIQLTNCVTPPPEKCQYSDAIINTMSGESPLVIPDSAERVNKGLELGGKTEQVQTTGKNLANPSEFVVGTIAGDTGNIINLKQYITTGYIPVIPGKSYSTSCGNKFLAHTIFAYDKEKTKINSVINMSSEMPEGAAYIRLSYKKIDMTNVTESDMEELKKVCMVNEGSTVLPYEPYTGGKPSPSPEYLQEIKNSGKWNEEKQKYEIVMQVKGADTELQSLTLTSDRPLTKWDRLVEQSGQIGWLYGSVIATIDETAIISLYEPKGFYVYVKNIDKKEKTGYCDKLYAKRMSNGEPFVLFGNANNNVLYTLNTQEFYGKTVSEIKEKLKEYPLNIIGKSETTEFVPLPQSEQNAIRALKTYYPTTVITADGGELDPDIKVTYTADTKNYIDNKFAQLQKSLVNTNTQLL